MTNDQQTLAFEAAMEVARHMAKIGCAPAEITKAAETVIDAARAAAEKLVKDAQ